MTDFPKTEWRSGRDWAEAARCALHTLRVLLPELDALVLEFVVIHFCWEPQFAFCDLSKHNQNSVSDAPKSTSMFLRITDRGSSALLSSDPIVQLAFYFLPVLTLPARQTIAELRGRWSIQVSESEYPYRFGICRVADTKPTTDRLLDADWSSPLTSEAATRKIPEGVWPTLDSSIMKRHGIVHRWAADAKYVHESNCFTRLATVLVHCGRQTQLCKPGYWELFTWERPFVVHVLHGQLIHFRVDFATGRMFLSTHQGVAETDVIPPIEPVSDKGSPIIDIGQWHPCVSFMATGSRVQGFAAPP